MYFFFEAANCAGLPFAKKKHPKFEIKVTMILVKYAFSAKLMASKRTLRVSLLVLRNAGVQKTPVILSLIGLIVLSEYFCFRMYLNSITGDIVWFYSSRVISSTHLDDSN